VITLRINWWDLRVSIYLRNLGDCSNLELKAVMDVRKHPSVLPCERDQQQV
jgi:hypothetical protein